MERRQVLGMPRPAHLAVFLIDARRRGLPFSRAWSDAMSVVCGAARERNSWATVFAETRDCWRRAYEGLPATSAEQVLGDLVPALVGDMDGDGLAWRVCGWCEGPIAAGRDPRARFCSDGCRRRAHYHTHERMGGGGPGRVRSTVGDGGGVTSLAA